MTALTLQLPPNLKFTDDEFEQIVAVNKNLRLELTAEGELVIMSPTGGETGNRNFDLLGQLWFWNSKNNLGKAMYDLFLEPLSKPLPETGRGFDFCSPSLVGKGLGVRFERKSQMAFGKAFDSSTGFKLPNGATRSPDASWIKMERWDALTPEQRKNISPCVQILQWNWFLKLMMWKMLKPRCRNT